MQQQITKMSEPQGNPPAIQPILIDKQLASSLLPKRRQDTHKGDYGRLLLVAGSVGMGGAAQMATKAALRAGAGITVLATPESVATGIAPTMMEAMVVPLPQTSVGSISSDATPLLAQLVGQSKAMVLGCGMGQNRVTVSAVRTLIAGSNIPLVLDADGINAFARDITIIKELSSPCILTPHAGELSRLLGISIAEVEENRLTIARSVAKNLGVILVLKGHQTLVALPDGRVFQNTTGNAGLAKGGSGDVLAGIIGGLLCQRHLTPESAAILGVYLHGLAGDYCAFRMSQYSMLASDLIEALPFVFKQTESLPPQEPEQSPEKPEDTVEDSL